MYLPKCVLCRSVKVAREHLAAANTRYFLINTGNANAGTGAEGEKVALQCCQWLADAAGVQAEQVLPFSTGVIGEALPADKIHAAILSLCGSCSRQLAPCRHRHHDDGHPP